MYPFIKIFKIQIPSYGFMLLLALLTSMLFVYIKLKKENKALEEFIVVAACMLGFGILFSFLLFIVTTFPLAVIKESFFSGKLFLMLNGGVFLGGFIGGLFGAFIGSLIAKTPLFFYESELVPCIPLGHTFGRIGCFLAGCCYGIPFNGKIGVIYKTPIGTAPIGVPLLPIQLIEACFNFLIFIILNIFLKKPRKKGETLALYILLYSIIRFTLEYFRYDAIRGKIFMFSTSQFICLVMFILSVLFFTTRRKN